MNMYPPQYPPQAPLQMPQMPQMQPPHASQHLPTVADLEQNISDADAPPLYYPGMPDWERKIEDTLAPFQRYVRKFMMDRPCSGIFLTMGGGKTLVTLSALSKMRLPGHTLVVAPKNIARMTWADEIKKWDIPLRHLSLDVRPPRLRKNGTLTKSRKLSRDERIENYARVLDDPPGLYTISLGLFEDLIEYFTTAGGTRKADPSLWPFRNVIVDESQTFKESSTKRFKNFQFIRDYVEHVILLSGTPAAESTENLWSQIWLLDRGQALYPDKQRFLDRWFTPRKITPQVVKYEITEANRLEIYQRIRHLALAAENTDLKLPDCHIVDHRIELSVDEKRAYEQFRRDSVIEIVTAVDPELLQHDEGAETPAVPLPEQDASDPQQALLDAETARLRRRREIMTIVADNSAILNGKLLQFATGSLYVSEEDAAGMSEEALARATEITKRPTVRVHDHKIAKALEIVQSAQDNCLIAYRFQSDRDRLLHWFKLAGIDARQFDGTGEMKDAWNRGEIPVMLLHPASAGHGLNFQYGGHTMIWFNLPHSSEHYQQANARLHRTGQTEEVTIHRIIVSDTQDAQLPGVLAGKRRVEKSLMAALQREVGADVDAL